MNFAGAVERARSLLRGRHFSSIVTLVVVAAIAASVAVLAVDQFQPLTNADNFIKDIEFAFAAHDQPSDDRVRVVAIDEDTLHHLPYRSPIDRGMLAELLTRLDESIRASSESIFFSTSPPSPRKMPRWSASSAT